MSRALEAEELQKHGMGSRRALQMVLGAFDTSPDLPLIQKRIVRLEAPDDGTWPAGWPSQ